MSSIEAPRAFDRTSDDPRSSGERQKVVHPKITAESLLAEITRPRRYSANLIVDVIFGLPNDFLCWVGFE